MNSRRSFIKKSSAIASGVLITPTISNFYANASKAKFRICLNAGAIGVSLSQQELIQAAVKYGFESIVCHGNELLQMETTQIDGLLSEMKNKNLEWGSAGLPVDFRKDAQTFEDGLDVLTKMAKKMAIAGATRMNTWIMPTHHERTYRENFHLHGKRIRTMANILGHYDIRLGLEYVGPKTLMTRDKYSFIRTMAEAKDLLDLIGEPNVGFVLDSFHWYCAGEDASDILGLDKDQIVTVDLNDAKPGRGRDGQIDNQRELPLATGVIPLKEFLTALADVGYEGPVRAEPFNQELRDLEDGAAMQKTFDAMKKSVDLVR